MQSMNFERFGDSIGILDCEVPKVSPTGVVIKVEATGLCRSDWHGWMGHDTDISLPHVPGHEFAGVVTEVGSQVSRVKVGERVTVPFVCGCGTCEWCRSGNAQVCPNQTQPGFTHWGSFAQFVSIENADFNVVELPDSISFETAAALGCRFATAFRGLKYRAKVQQGQWVAVFGCGGVGLSAIMIAKALGAQVIAVDVFAGALDKAKEMGADFVINSHLEDPIEGIKEISSGGVHIGVEALGSEATANQSIRSLRRQGKHIQLGLLLTESGLTPISMARVIAWELEILGSHGMAAADYPEMLDLVSKGLLHPDRLIERRIDLASGAQALAMMATVPTPGITIINPWL